MPDGTISTTFLADPDEILALLHSGRHMNSSHFSTTYDIQEILLAAAVIALIAVDVTNDDSYFKFNLDYITFYNLIRSLIRLENGSVHSIYRSAYALLRAATASHQNAFFDIIDLGVDTPVYLTLYGTGIRNRSSLAGVSVTISGMSVPVLYAGPQPQTEGTRPGETTF
jgi:hypothetical protein